MIMVNHNWKLHQLELVSVFILSSYCCLLFNVIILYVHVAADGSPLSKKMKMKGD